MDVKLKKDLGARLLLLRNARKMSQGDVAQAADITGSFAGRIEKGLESPTIDTFFDMITGGLKISLGEFFLPWLPAPKDKDATALEAMRNAIAAGGDLQRDAHAYGFLLGEKLDHARQEAIQKQRSRRRK